jgi:hypothetical protein
MKGIFVKQNCIFIAKICCGSENRVGRLALKHLNHPGPGEVKWVGHHNGGIKA